MDVTMAVAAEDVRFAGADTDNARLNITGVFDQVVRAGMICALDQIAVDVGFSADATEFGAGWRGKVRQGL